ncbi:MAG: hypothetical protein IKC75_07090 [Clostridia bacterium]|nr:hypothetical protein [Clostridia bacterium]
MLRGCQKQMIVLQTPESPLFESAFFVLRRDMGEPRQADMQAEANRLVGNETYLRKRPRFAREAALFFAGFLGGVLTCLLIYFLRMR